MKKMNNQQGFTLIELIVVIVILGILAVTAAPKFLSFTADARASTMEGLSASVKGAIQLVHAKEAIAGKETVTTAAATSGSGLDTIFGYPAATVASIGSASGINSAADGSSEYTHIIGTGKDIFYYPASIYNTTTPLTETTVVTGACYVKYKEAATSGADPVVTMDVTGCDS